MLGRARHDGELAAVGAVHPQLGRGHGLRQVREQSRERPAPVGDVAQQPRGCEQGVVETVPVAAKEHVAAHLARERRA